MSSGKITKTFRDFIESKSPFLAGVQEHDAVQHADECLKQMPLVRGLQANWEKYLEEPFVGVSSDGTIRTDVFQKSDDGIDTDGIVKSAHDVVNAMSETEKHAALYPIDAKERRMWQNTHLYVFRIGIRLEDASVEVRKLVLNLLETVMSREGYQKSFITMESNEFLGSLYNAQGVLNRYSYNFLLFGTPSTTEPWGWTFFGHHLCLNFFIYGSHIEITPTFMGAEPNVIDEGPLAGTRLFEPEEELALKIMRGLPPALQSKARLGDSAALPPGGGHNWVLAGAFRDNRVIPLEGVAVSEVSEQSKSSILKLVDQFVLYLPSQARRRKLQEVEKYLGETWFCWIGGSGDSNTFYYRIQSPVILCEFEHCPSIFLGNTGPEKFHIHTHVRTPNGGDYGHALMDGNC